MLVSFSVENFLSFKGLQTLRMDAVDHARDNINPSNVFSEVSTQDARLLKSALIFGANASGKTNLIKAFMALRAVVLHSQNTLDESDSPTLSVIPYLLSEETRQAPTTFEIVFYEANIKYRYGLEVKAGAIEAEWLFYTPEARETALFNREGTSIELNKTGFSEASSFVKDGKVQQTRTSVPFISVLAAHNGEHAQNIISWFNRLRTASGVDEHGYMGFTINLLKKNQEFKQWVLSILREFDIYDLSVNEVELPKIGSEKFNNDKDISNLFSAINNLSKTQKFTRLQVTKKIDSSDEMIEFPLEFESEGTRKLIHLLGPIYDAIKNKRVLLMDEVESKFHSLLTRFIFNVYHKSNATGSQIIATAHDTNLMDMSCFRRDQIWFVDKKQPEGSRLYSLIEFKEKARKLKEQYGPDYLAGAFGAVSLFENFKQIDELM